MGKAGADFISIYCYLALGGYNAVRHGECFNKRLIISFCKRLCFHCKHSRSLIRKYRYSCIIVIIFFSFMRNYVNDTFTWCSRSGPKNKES